MASYSPSTASHWLFRATAKHEKSIFRIVEHKYKNLIKDFEKQIKSYKRELKVATDIICKLDDDVSNRDKHIEELEAKLFIYTKPDVAVKDVQDEIFRVKPRNVIKEEGKKRRLEINKEVEELTVLRDAPPSKILKVSPAPRSIPPPPGKPKTHQTEKTRERSTSPRPSSMEHVLKRERSTSPTLVAFIPGFLNRPLEVTAHRKKRKKRKNQDIVVSFTISF